MKKNYFKKASIALSLVALFGAADLKAQVVVAATAGNTGPLTYSTLNQAFGAINSGTHQGVITISITANTTETTVLNPLLASGNGTTSYTSISIKPSGGNFTINSSPTPSANRGIIELAGADNVTIDGDDPATAGSQNLSIVSTVTTTSGIACIRLSSNSATGLDGANNNTIKNCIMRGSRDAITSQNISYGVQFSDGVSTSALTSGANSSTNTIIQGNTILRCLYGIHAIGTSTAYLNYGIAITSNTLGSATAADNIGLRGIDISYSDITSANTSSINLNNIMMGNTTATATVMGIEIGAANTSLRVARNYIHDATASPAGAYGIALTSAVNSNSVIIRNNFIRDMKGGAVTSAATQINGGIGVMITASVTDIVINNNTIAQLAAASLGSCVHINHASATISKFLNNAVVNNVSNTFAYCFYTTATVNISGGSVNTNDYFVNAPTGNLGYYNAANRPTLATWTTATNMDLASFSVLPGFVSATDLHIIPGQASLLESTGTGTATTGVGIDYDGDSRPGPVGSIYGGGQNPDIGADEFDGLLSNCATLPTVTITASPTGTICNGSVTLTAGGAQSYTWNTGGSNANPFIVTPTVTTTYTVVGTSSLGCTGAAIITVTAAVAPTLTAVSSATAICIGGSVSITGSGNLVTYTLSSGSANGGTFAPTSTAVYTVSGTNVCGTVTQTLSINVNPLPTVTAVSSPTTVVCAGTNVTLTASSANLVPASSYSWSTGAATSTLALTAPTVNTTYTVVGTTSLNCSSSAVVTVSTNTTPTLTVVTSPTSGVICLNNTITITGTGNLNTYTISGGTANGGTLAPTATTVYTVSGTNACGTTSTSVSITVNPLPTLTVSASSGSICSGATVTLTVNGNAASYTWAATSATTTSLSAAPTTTTNYSVTATSAQGCTATAVNVVSVVTTPVVSPIASPYSVCSGGSTTLQVSGATNYTWLPGNASTSLIVVTPATVSVITPITYTITKSNSNCVNTQQITFTVFPLPNLFAVVNPVAVCAGSQATLTAGGATNFTWTPATTPTTGATVLITPTVTTTYTYTGYNGTCAATSTITVPVSPVPTISIVSSNTAVCLNSSVANFTASGASTYTWTNNTSTVVYNGSQISVSPTVVTNYVATGGNTFALGAFTYTCTSTANQLLFVNQLPVITINPSSTIICLGKTVTLSATSNSAGTNYQWDANANNAISSSVAVTPTVTTVYSVLGGVGSTGCIGLKTATVQVFDPTFTAPTNTAICKGSTITITSSGPNTTSYTWSPGNQHAGVIAISPSVSTTYTVAGTSTILNVSTVLNCQASYTFNVAVNPNPTVTASASSTIMCRGEHVLLSAAGASTYVWAPAAGTGSTVSVNSVDFPNYINTVNYTVTGSDANNCKAKATVLVATSGCVGIEQQSANTYQVLIYPNPNNGEFTIKSDENITLTIVNELGQSIRTITLSDANGHNALVSEMSNGIYFIVGANANGSVKQKIIINK